MPFDRTPDQEPPRLETTAGDAASAAPAAGACIAPAARASTGVRRSAWRKAPPSMPIVVYKRAGTRRKPALLPLLVALDELAYGPSARERLRRDGRRLGIDLDTLRMVQALARKLAGDALRRDVQGDASVAPRGRSEVLSVWSAGLDEAVSRCGQLVAAGLSQAGIRAVLAESFRLDPAQPAAPDCRSNSR
jgi:hypothetical protein